MNKKAILALLLAMLLPFTGYWIVKYVSKDAVHMPPHYFYDSIGVQSKRGKQVDDTIWHKVANMQFTNQLGNKVSLDDLHGKILVIDFFFTSCPSICPGLARNMRRMQKSFEKNDSIVQFLTISIDPERDSIPRLRSFADKFEANHDSWWFLTGNKQEIYNLALKEMKATTADPGIDTGFIHSENFYLLDSNRVIRGWYNGFDTIKLAQLARDIPTLMLERDKKSPSIFREFIPILPIIFIAIGLVIFGTAWLGKKRKLKPNY